MHKNGTGKPSFMSAANIETVSTTADKARLVLVVALVVAALAGFYMLPAQGAIVQWLTLVGGLLAAVVVFLLSLPGRQLVAFGNDAWREVNKVVWPTRKESTQMTLYVFAFVVIMALFLWLTDKTLEWVFYDLILGWKK
jgi:preprotein translocase subunit SecE